MAAIRKLFRSSDKIAEPEGASSSTNSPSRRLLNRHHRPDAVTPVDGPILENPDSTHADRSCFFKAKKSAKVTENSRFNSHSVKKNHKEALLAAFSLMSKHNRIASLSIIL